MTDQPARLEVTQADRELYSALYLWMNEEKRLAIAGDFDERPAMQTIARHRLAHAVPGDAGWQPVWGNKSVPLGRKLLVYRDKNGHSIEHYDGISWWFMLHEQSSPDLWRELPPIDAALSTSPVIDTNEGLAERVRALLQHDPNWVAAGIPDNAIEAGIVAMHDASREMDERNAADDPSLYCDWDEGMLVAAIFKAVARAALDQG